MLKYSHFVALQVSDSLVKYVACILVYISKYIAIYVPDIYVTDIHKNVYVTYMSVTHIITIYISVILNLKGQLWKRPVAWH